MAFDTVPVSTDFSVSVTLGIAAPVGSETVPLSVALKLWARPALAETMTHNNKASDDGSFLAMALPSLLPRIPKPTQESRRPKRAAGRGRLVRP